MGINIKSCLTALVLTIGLFGRVTEIKADPAKPYRFDVRTIAAEMCNEFLAIPESSIEDVEGCKASYDHCVATLADLAATTADFKHFYREEPYVYYASVSQYFVFIEEFRKFHFCIKMVRFDDASDLEIPMTTSFELTFLELKEDVGGSCKLEPIFPVDPCGNGLIDSGETCDDGIDNGKPGKCPDTCRYEVKILWRSHWFDRLDVLAPRYDVVSPKK
jgi:hypothetical protein